MTAIAQRWVWITFKREGFHLYPGADTDPSLATGGWDDVSYLGVRHRHLFGVRVQLEVFHNERDVEFHQLSRWCQKQYSDGSLEFNGKSCETIAEELGEAIRAKYSGRALIISVDEDGECGSTLEWSR